MIPIKDVLLYVCPQEYSALNDVWNKVISRNLRGAGVSVIFERQLLDLITKADRQLSVAQVVNKDVIRALWQKDEAAKNAALNEDSADENDGSKAGDAARVEEVIACKPPERYVA